MAEKTKRFWCLTVVFILFLVFLLPPTQMKAAESAARKRIAIVLDNSDSMIIRESTVPYLPRWAEATYALRTLLHMIGDQDEVALYTVSDGKTLGGKIMVTEDLTKDNIDQNLLSVGISAVTKTDGLKAAYQWAARADSGVEKWVVILSDGEFYGENMREGPLLYSVSVGEPARVWNASGVRTIFIGLDLPEDDLNDLKREYSADGYNIFDSSVADGGGIEQAILDISEEIYGMKELDFNGSTIGNFSEFCYDAKEGALTWETSPGLSSYLQQVTVIAQAENVTGDGEILDEKMQLVRSDSVFSWCAPEDLEEVLRIHDIVASQKYHLGPKDTFLQKIQDTFLNKYCYVRTYIGSEIGDSIVFQTPPGEYTYRIYYELKADITPELVVTQDGAEVQPDPEGVYSVAEGVFQLDYRLKSGQTELPRELDVIRKELEPVRLDAAALPDSDARAVQWTLDYEDSGSNRYTVETAFHGMTTENMLQVELDVRNYSLTIPPGQDLCLDQPDENRLTVITDLPENWLRANLRSHVQDDLADSVEPHAALQISDLTWGPGEAGKTEISIPMYASRTDPKSFSDLLPASVTISGATGGENRLSAGSTVSASQATPELSLTEPEKRAGITNPFKKPVVANITAMAGTYDVTEATTLENVSITGLGDLADIKWVFDGDALKIRYAGDWRSTWTLLWQNINSGRIRVEGSLYRDGELKEEHFQLEGTVSWSGTLWQFCFGFLPMLIAVAVSLFHLILLATGHSMLIECFSQKTGGVKDATFPIYWKWEDTDRTVDHLHCFPFMISIAFYLCNELSDADKRCRIRLYGTWSGYRLTNRSLQNLPPSIKLKSNGRHMQVLHTAGDFCFSIRGESLCTLKCRKDRSRLLESAAVAAVILVCAFLTFLIYLVF